MDRANKFLECIRVERSEDPDPTRPLILLGHSLGGLLIEQVSEIPSFGSWRL